MRSADDLCSRSVSVSKGADVKGLTVRRHCRTNYPGFLSQMGMIFLKQRMFALVVIFCLTLFSPVFAVWASASPEQDKALEIMNSRTSFRWGEDVLVWVLHYPEELIDPWVASESARKKMNAEQTARYRQEFVNELRSGSATAIMLSVHYLGVNPLKLAPVSKNVALLDSSGKRVAPIAFEKKLDNPISGLTQGLIYFPKQSDDNFRIAVKTQPSGKEIILSFTETGASNAIFTASPGSGRAQKTVKEDPAQPKEVVVTIPTVKPPVLPKAPSASLDPKNSEPEFSLDGETYPPYEPYAQPAQQSPQAPASQSALPPAPEPQPKEVPAALRLSPAQVLDIFLKAWARGEPDRMYELLSTESQSKISKALFEKDVLSSGGFRQGLRDGYKVSWEADGAKVTVAQKLLLVRTLSSRRFTFVEENGSPRIAW